ncbi:DUF1275 domain-containing protein [Silvanigrella paludirubra]|uniref:DUF1275 domain-containing protein n=1 Tax=Silvanigrella paludirubra TaxID=2499159 RepID=A0A6N6VYL6_9BACT|nr:YoaK family protein [Silvanigrella paludirubra]KAB8040012.1 DUF1275 domain-containing protein [Silvanigrella paludirubra]
MEKKRFLYFGDFPSEISYLLCFVGGCTDCISFILLFHSLVGFMTVNTLYGVVGFAQNAVSFASLYHLLIVIVFVFFVLSHQIYKQIYSKSKHLQPQKELFHAFFTKCIFYFLFMVSAHILYKLGHLKEANIWALIVVSIASFSSYIQNYNIKSGHPIAISTAAMTGNYVSLLSELAQTIINPKQFKSKKNVLKHHLFVQAHFWSGVIVTCLLSKYFDFLSLIIPFFVLVYLTFRSWKKI